MSDQQQASPAGTFQLDTAPPVTPPQRRAGLVAALVLLVLGILTLRDFLPALAWASIFAVGLWPQFTRTAARFPRHRRAGLPLLFTLGVLLIFVVPLAMVLVPLVGDAHAAGAWFADAKVHGIPAPPMLGDLPYGDRLTAWWRDKLGQPGQVSVLLGHAMQGGALKTARAVGKTAIHRFVLLGFMLLSFFFLLRDGEEVAAELRIGSRRAFGPTGEDVGRQIIRSIHGTINGLVLVGLGEGVILGVAYAVLGVPHPALFGLITALFAMVPFGAPVAFGLAALVLAATAGLVPAAILVGLGTVVTFVADHFVRPVLIGGATRLPFVWVLLGILGGVEAWGLVGLFVGPAIMAALVLLWREWVGAAPGPLNPTRAATTRPEGTERFGQP